MQPDQEDFIPMTEARANLTEMVDNAHFRDKATVLVTRGKPRAVVVSYEWYMSKMYPEGEK